MVIELPFDKLVHNHDRVFRGWRVSGDTQFTSGLPVWMTDGSSDNNLRGDKKISRMGFHDRRADDGSRPTIWRRDRSQSAPARTRLGLTTICSPIKRLNNRLDNRATRRGASSMDLESTTPIFAWRRASRSKRACPRNSKPSTSTSSTTHRLTLSTVFAADLYDCGLPVFDPKRSKRRRQLWTVVRSAPARVLASW